MIVWMSGVEGVGKFGYQVSGEVEDAGGLHVGCRLIYRHNS